VELDLPTLFVAEGFVAALSGLVILLGCPPGRDARGRGWWVLGSITTAVAIALMISSRLRGSETLAVLGNLAFVLGPAFYWSGARTFSRRPPLYPLIPLGALIVVLFILVPPLRIPPSTHLELNLAISTLYFAAGAFELWRGRDERIFARWPLIVLFAIHALLFASGTVEAMLGTLIAREIPPLTSWFGLIHFESIVFYVGVAVLVVAFVRERREFRQRMVAEVDPLTGVATRRAFLEQTEEALERFRRDAEPLSMAIFDLDHFKSINDRFGHAMGDEVLRRFGETMRGALRSGDHVGRLGGEEFALLMPGTGLAAAIVVADQVRVTFEAAGREVEGVPVGGTVSAGVAAAGPGSSSRAMLIAADEGLYGAKAKGRNRVERAPATNGRDGKPFLNRVA